MMYNELLLIKVGEKMRNVNIITLSLVLLVSTGCSMFGGADLVEVPQRTAINNQEFSTFFEDDGIKVNWECIDRDWFPSLGFSCEKKELKSIEITVTAPTGGGTNFVASNAQRIGEEEVRAKLATFIAGETETETTTKIVGLTDEVQDDTYRNPIEGTGQNANTPRLPAVVGMSSSGPSVPRDPNPNMNFAVTSNSHSTAREVQTLIKTQAQAIIRGLAFNYNKVDDQLLQVTGIWNKNTADQIQNDISSYFN
jgi:hypothetical protein